MGISLTTGVSLGWTYQYYHLDFRSPLVSFLYESGWCQNFNQSGFPGPDEEFKMAQDYFEPVAGGLLADVSCGSGLFTRKFASSGTYSAVIALGFSENMLPQCYEFIRNDDTLLDTFGDATHT